MKLLLSLFIAFPSYGAVYNCTFQIMEDVKVARYEIKFNNSFFDFSKGVPKQMILKEEILRPEFFKRGFEALYYASSPAVVIYNTDNEHPIRRFSFDTQDLVWNTNIGSRHQAEMKFRDPDSIGEVDTYGFSHKTKPTDTLGNSTLNGLIDVHVRGRFDIKLNKTSFYVELYRPGVNEIYSSSSEFEIDPKKDDRFAFSLNLFSGFHFFDFNDPEGAAFGKYDSIKVECLK